MDASKLVLSESTLKEELKEFEYNAVDFIYSLPPNQSNLFWAGNLASEFRTGIGADDTKDNTFDLLDSSFRIQKISFPEPSIKVSRKLGREIIFENFESDNTVTIDYLEDAYNTITMYHREWLSCWYNVEKQCVVSGIEGKFRNLDIAKFHYVSTKGGEELGTFGDVVSQTPEMEILARYKIVGLVPTSKITTNLDYGESENSSKISVTYSYRRIYCDYNKELLKKYPKLQLPNAIS